MPKGYWIPHIDVKNTEGYKAYTDATPEAHRKYSGRALVRGGTFELLEGKVRSRNVLREFPSYEAALACYRSPEYQGAKPLRLSNAEADFVIVEGGTGVEPGFATSIAFIAFNRSLPADFSFAASSGGNGSPDHRRSSLTSSLKNRDGSHSIVSPARLRLRQNERCRLRSPRVMPT